MALVMLQKRLHLSRILVVEDHLDSRELLVDYLSDQGFVVDTAGNGDEALQVLRRAGPPPDLILLDLTMPVMDGWTLRERLLQEDRWAGIPVIVVSALGNLPHPREILASIPKPLDLELLVDTIHRLAPAN